MKTDDLDFELPPHLIAQEPSPSRDQARLLHYSRSTGRIAHETFSDLPRFLRPGDLLVFNNSRVLPAKLLFQKETGGRVEGLFLHEIRPGLWRVLLKNAGPPGSRLHFLSDPARHATLVNKDPQGCTLELDQPDPAQPLLLQLGRMPLPPYIKRQKEHDPLDSLDRDRYQTVYADLAGSIAAPTAGLHFTPDLLARLESQGIQQTHLTLHVGLGTFKPVVADDLDRHAMHTEPYEISPAAADAINLARRESRRIIAVGTTSARVLESQPPGQVVPGTGQTDLLIRPPYAWKHVSALITNFHLPRSTLIALVAAFVGLDAQRKIYREAIAASYRFFSYGDSSFLE